MGLTSWKSSHNDKIMESDVVIAKNYLKQDEIRDFEKYRVKQDKLYKADFDLLIEEANSTEQ